MRGDALNARLELDAADAGAAVRHAGDEIGLEQVPQRQCFRAHAAVASDMSVTPLPSTVLPWTLPGGPSPSMAIPVLALPLTTLFRTKFDGEAITIPFALLLATFSEI